MKGLKLLIFCTLSTAFSTFGQVDSLRTSSSEPEEYNYFDGVVPRTTIDTTSNPSDSLSQIDKTGLSNTQDTIPQIVPPVQKKSTIKIADEGLESELIFGALDSQVFDNKSSIMHLYGDAYVKYEGKELYADYIQLDMDQNIADAMISELKPNAKKPVFIDGGKEYVYRRLRYNFEKEKGLVYDAVSQEGEFLIHADKTKYVSGGDNVYSQDDVIYNSKSLITTCNHDHPHFGFRAKKLKLIPDKIAVMGPANLVLGGVPTPVVVPFGFFPLVQGKSSGFIFPQNFEFNSRALGFGVRGFGWYFPINDQVHVRLTADLYSRGSFGLYSNTSYKKRYKYTGQFDLAYNNILTEIATDTQPSSEKGVTIGLRHTQDSKAHPFVNVGGNINIVYNNNNNRVFNDAESVLTSTYNSNFFYRNSMPGTPFNFNLGMSHNQNTRTNAVNISFPDISLNMNTIFPFKREGKGSNTEKWYEKISLKYDLAMKNYIRTTDKTLFTTEVWDDMKAGINQKASLGFSTRFLKHFNFSPSANYTENWVFNTIDKENFIVTELDSNDVIIATRDSIVTNTLGGFSTYRTYNAGANVSTQMFGTMKFSKGWLRGLRHTMKPSVGFSFAPDTRTAYTDTLYYADIDRAPLTYTRFDEGAYSTGFTNLSSLLNFEIRNVVELKHWSKKDSTEKKIKLFDNFTVRSNYNFAKDSTQWDLIRINTTTRLFKNYSTLATIWRFDPYMENDKNVAIGTTVWSDRKKIARLEYGEINWSNTFKVKDIINLFSKKKKKDEDEDEEEDKEERNPLDQPKSEEEIEALFEEEENSRPGGLADRNKKAKRKQITLESIIENLRIRHNLVYEFRADNNKVVSKMRTHNISIQGSIPLTENWSVGIGNVSYDFVKNGLGYTDVIFSRKLHCWNMNFSWRPSRDTYTFFIGVNSSNLSFLKYDYGQNNFDGFGNRF